ncbi:MAG: hypothetical protein R2765_03845 [Ferruginibacter sp.]
MLSKKNISPQQLSALTALGLSVPIAIGIFIFKPVWWIALLSFAVIFLGSFALILYTLQTFIYRKIKLIYKSFTIPKQAKKKNFIIKIFYPKKVLMKLGKM